MNREHTSIKTRILELCSEDDYGSWELWWAVMPEIGTVEEDELRHDFVNTVGELINTHAIAAKKKGSDSKLSAAVFSKRRLDSEIRNASKPDPSRYYWFGVPEI